MSIRRLNIFYSIIKKTFGLVIAFTFFSMLFLKKAINCPAMNRTEGHDGLYFCFMFVFTFTVFMIIRKFWKEKQYDRKRIHYVMVVVSVLIYAVQLLILRCIWFETGWDVTCVYYDAVHRAEEGILLGSHEYFTVSPNNVMLTFIFAVICKILNIVGIRQYYLVLCCIGAFLINTAGYMVFQTVFKLSESIKTSVVAWSVYTLFISLSPWMSVPYTDVYTIIFPIGIFYLLLCRPKKNLFKIGKWIFIGFLTILGYYIKPTAAIMTIAIVLVHFINLFVEKNKKYNVIVMILLVVGCLSGILFNIYAKQYMGFVEDEDKALPIAHYLMLGQNDKTYGVFDNEDRNLTLSFATKEEKIANGLKVAKERFMVRGFLGNLRFFTIKNMVNYNNGTFSWAYEGDFFKDVSIKNDKISVFLRDVYYPEGEYHKKYAEFCQGIWLIILFGCIGLMKEEQWEKYVVPMLAVLGITAFLLIFESRARYLFLFTPVYVALGSIGLKNIYANLEQKIHYFIKRMISKKSTMAN